MVKRVAIAVVVAVAVTLACILLGTILTAAKVTLLVSIGNFLKNFNYLLGLMVGVWYFVTH